MIFTELINFLIDYSSKLVYGYIAKKSIVQRYGVNVHGIDLSTNMTGIAHQYRNEMEPEVKHR